MAKKVKPIMCLCGKVPEIETNHFGGKSGWIYRNVEWWTACRNPKCPVQPTGPDRKTRNGAVNAWNRWITQGLRRLGKVVEEE